MSVPQAISLALAAAALTSQPPTLRLTKVSRVVADLDRAERFYRHALGFTPSGRGAVDAAALAALGMAGCAAEQVLLRLGGDTVALVKVSPPGRPCPVDSCSDDLWFQHLAIVVDDMDAAYRHLGGCPGWHPVSNGGPQRLPPLNGSVRAFKFRDPDGHPLELIWFPPGTGRAAWHGPALRPLFLGIDHSAIAVSSTARSLRFYRALGLCPASRSWNHGPAQSRLDGLPGAKLRVTGLRPAGEAGPGLELLRYVPPGRPDPGRQPADTATDWVTLAVQPTPGGAVRMVRDPDGHMLLLDQGAGSSGAPA